MSNILFSALQINSKKTGIGTYGESVLRELDNFNPNYNITALVQNNIKLKNIEISSKKYKNSYTRIIAEQGTLYNYYRKFDLIHFTDYSTPMLNVNKPYITTIHDLSVYKFNNIFTPISKLTKKAIIPKSLARANKIIAVSENTKKDIISLFNINESKIKVIYLSSPGYRRERNINKIEAIKQKYKIHGKYILYLGTIEPRKNIINLIKAYNALKSEQFEKKLVIAGKKGWMYKEVYQYLIKNNLEKDIIFTGYVKEEEKPLLYSGAEVFVYPSLYEGFGLPPLEAMSCGIPVIVSNNSSLPEVVGDSGIYINPTDITSIAKAIYQVSCNEELRNKLGKKGVERSRIFSWDKTAKETIKIWNEVLSNN